MHAPGPMQPPQQDYECSETREAGSAARLNNRQTVVIVGTTLTVGVCICAMIFASTLAIRADIRAEFRKVDANLQAMRTELRGKIATLRQELGTKIDGLQGAKRQAQRACPSNASMDADASRSKQ